MKKLLVGLLLMFVCAVAFAHNIEWYVDDTVYQTTTCNSGDNITPPTAPAKYGYHFTEWEEAHFIHLEYIESTGTQYINTGFKFTSNKGRIVSKFMQTGTSETDQRLCGAFYSSLRSMPIYLRQSGDFYLGVGSNDILVYNTFASNQEYVIDVLADNGSISGTINNVAISPDTYSGTIANDRNFWLFNENQTANLPFYGRIYYFQIYDNGTLARDFIPVKSPGGAIGMYDTVTDTFFENAGTGNFIAGPEVGYL